MTAPTLVADDRESRTRLIPAAELRAGHVVDFFGVEHRIDRFLVERRGAIDEPTSVMYDGERNPARRIAVSADGWALTLMPDQMIPVRVPTGLYELEVFHTRTPHEPSEIVKFAAESDELVETTARRILVLLDASWGNVLADGVDISVVEVRR